MHHSFIIPGVIDEAVVRKQAYARLTDGRFPSETTIHYHGNLQSCNDRCELITSRSEDSDG